MNIILLSTKRCGMSWIGSVISQIYERLYGTPLEINYENDRVLISKNLVSGWHGVYDIDPKILLDLGYDKILIIKRELETLKEAHALYNGYLEIYDSLEKMKEERPAFFEKIELYYKLLYEQEDVINDPRVLLISLEDLNNYSYSTFNEIIEFLDFKLSFKQKIKLFLRIMKNKIYPFIIPINPTNRNWELYSTLLPKGYELCKRLVFLKKFQNTNKIIR